MAALSMATMFWQSRRGDVVENNYGGDVVVERKGKGGLREAKQFGGERAGEDF